jgi:OOP family OmpA-OmpF porin
LLKIFVKAKEVEIMKLKKLIFSAGVALIATSAISNVYAYDGGYVQDASGIGVKSADGKCVRSAVGAMLDGCFAIPAAGAIMKPPAPVVVPPPAPVVVAKPKPKPLPPIVKVLTLNEAGGSNFAFDSDKLSPKGIDQLTTFTSAVKSSNVSPASVSVVGHTDSIGSETYNQTLSERRANSVASFLASQGIDRGIMQVSGRGESQPVASNKSKAGRAQNRRVDIRVSGQRKITVRR